MKNVFFCIKCGMTYLREKKPTKCKPKGLLEKCDGTEFRRILTEDDLK